MVDISKVKTKKRTLRVETFNGGLVNMNLDVIKEVGNKLLYKTFNGSKELTLKEGKNYWVLTNTFNGNGIPEEWSKFIIWEE